MLTCKETNKKYIGITKYDIDCRFKQHVAYSKKKNNRKLSNAISKYGEHSFSVQLLEVVNDLEEANDREIFWIKHYNSFENGYNMTEGGDLISTSVKGKTYEEIYGDEAEEKRNMRRDTEFHKTERAKEIMRKNHWKARGVKNTWTSEAMKGTKRTEEAKKKTSETLRKTIDGMSEEQRKHTYRNNRENPPMLGKTHSEKVKRESAERLANRPTVTCPHCGKSSNSPVMNRWHFDKCKRNPDNVSN